MKINRTQLSHIGRTPTLRDRTFLRMSSGGDIELPSEAIYDWATAAAEDVVERLPDVSGGRVGTWEGDEPPVEAPDVYCPRCLSLGLLSPIRLELHPDANKKGYSVSVVGKCDRKLPDSEGTPWEVPCGYEATMVFGAAG